MKGINREIEKQILGIDDTQETVSQFRAKVDRAIIDGAKHVEASNEIFNHYVPQEKGNSFTFAGVRVFRSGTMEQTLESEKSNAFHDAAYGKAVYEGRT